MLDDLFQADNLKAASDLVARPAPLPKPAGPAFSLGSLLTAAPRGVATGAAQSGGFFADVLGAFGDMSVASGMGDPLLANPDKQVKAAEKIQREGLDFTTGDPLREFGRQFQPDAATAHVAERLVFDLSRFVTKAVGYTAAGGPVVGPAFVGADEALTTSDELRRQGVDLGTRSAAGAVVGAVSALGVGLPMAGRTALGTAGLVALGGPVSFVGQQAAVRKILQDADYSKLGEQYDPFDPVGLAISTLVPAAFGVHGLRVNKAAAAAKAAEDFRTGPVPSAETATAAAAREATMRPADEHVDAARTLLAVEERQRSNPARADDMQAVQAHETALAKAEEQIAAGERVSVVDVAPVPRDTTMAMPARYDASGDTLNSLPDAGNTANLDQLDMVELFHGSPETSVVVRDSGLFGGVFASPSKDSASSHGDYLLKTQLPDSAIMRQGDFDNVSDADLKKVAPWVKDDDLERLRELVIDDAQADDADAAILKVDDAGEASWEAQRLRGAIAKNAGYRAAEMNDEHGTSYLLLPGVELKSASQNEPSSPSPLGEFSARIAEAAALVKAEIEAQQNATAPTPRPAAEAQPQTTDARGTAAPRQAEADTPAAGSSAAKTGLVDDGAAARVAQVELDYPGLMVQLDGMDAPRPLAEVMAAVKAEADDMLADSELMQQAAACALLNLP